MNKKRFLLPLLALAALGATTAAAGGFDFDKAWKKVDEAARKDLPRTVTNKVDEIAREAAENR